MAMRARPTSTSTVNSLMQDVPGSFPNPEARRVDDGDDDDGPPHVSLAKAVYARRSEYTRSKEIRIKIGSWNVAGIKDTTKDVAGWFVEGKGVAETLAGLTVQDQNELHSNHEVPSQAALSAREDVAAQEARAGSAKSTLPKNDPGSLPGEDEVDLYVLAVQEIVDVTSASEAWNIWGADSGAAGRWKDAVSAALPSHYHFIAEQQLVGLYLIIFASEDLANEIKHVSTTSMGTGIGGMLGNKGAVSARLVLGETTSIVFVNSHLAAGADKNALERRNWDAAQIVSRTKFDPIKDILDPDRSTREHIGDEDFAFWMGDLNYRLSGIPGDDVRRLLMLHTRNEYDLGQPSAAKVEEQLAQATESVQERAAEEEMKSSSHANPDTAFVNAKIAVAEQDTRSSLQEEIEASTDPTSLQTTLTSLLPHDELREQMQTGKAFQDGWMEGPITFLPTYKYDVGSVGVFDSSEKKRAPSWCDRILYRTRRARLAYEARIHEEKRSQKKDAELRASGIEAAAQAEEVLYDYDPETDGDDDYNELNEGATQVSNDSDGADEGRDDYLRLEYYTAHQRVLSSDHKPLNAIFHLKYESVVPDLKAAVYSDVAKEFDKIENDGRPSVTVVVDKHRETDVETSDAGPGKSEGVSFGDVRWAQAKHRTITVANTGRVPANFMLIERPVEGDQDAGIAPNWLNLKINGTAISSSDRQSDKLDLEPGETCTIELEFRLFDITHAGQVNDQTNTLDDILVLRVENGRDHFIPIHARWLETTLGKSIDRLIRVPEGGIRKLQSEKSAKDERVGRDDDCSNQPVRFSAPRELLKLTEAVEQVTIHAIAEWEMTHARVDIDSRISSESTGDAALAPWSRFPGWPFDEAAWLEKDTTYFREALGDVQNALDEDLAVLEALPATLPQMQKVYVLAYLLVILLRNMPDGVVNTELWSSIADHMMQQDKNKTLSDKDDSNKVAAQEILSRQPSSNISFILIVAMLERIRAEIPTSNSHEHHEIVSQPSSPIRKAGASFRRMAALGRLPTESATSITETARTVIVQRFSDLLIRSPPTHSEKARVVQERRKQEFLALFYPS